MALITCPECESQVSGAAVSCPKCGCPIAPAAQDTIRGAVRKGFKNEIDLIRRYYDPLWPSHPRVEWYGSAGSTPQEIIESRQTVKRLKFATSGQQKRLPVNAQSDRANNYVCRNHFAA